MDANRLRFWMLSDAVHWHCVTPDDIHYDRTCKSLRLTSRRDLPPQPAAEDETEARARLARVPGAVDAFGTWAMWDPDRKQIVATGASGGVATLFPKPPDSNPAAPTDCAIGYDEALYIARGGEVVMQDLRSRWEPVTLSEAGFSAWRLAPHPQGGAFALGGPLPEAGSPPVPVKLARITGFPLPKQRGGYAPSVFRPHNENRDPPRLVIFEAPLSWPGEMPVALAVSPEGRLAVMTWVHSPGEDSGVAGTFARIRLLYGEEFGKPIALSGARLPYSFAWLSADRIAVLLTGMSDALTYSVEFGDLPAVPAGDFYPLPSHDGGPFLHGNRLPPHYGVVQPPSKESPEPPHPLLPISLPSLARKGIAQSMASPKKAGGVAGKPPLIDSGSARTEWHRIYLEGIIPPHCGIRVWLAATSVPEPPHESDGRAWHEHRFGVVEEALSRDIPKGVWVPAASEIPFHQGLLCCDRTPNQAGLFTVLIQRAGRHVRTLRGRYLWVRVELFGDGRTTPDLVALRAYASRFSYVEHYLPELYREAVFGEDADKTAQSTAADFLERFLDNCEGVFTPIEDKIASAFLLTDPRTVPEEAIEWLASWIGFTFDPVVPVARRRRLLQVAPALYRWRGTRRGLELALDAATDGAVARGAIVIVEDFKLRRTFSTILGADLADEDDPLLPGLSQSGNSFVGDTLILGDELHKEFLALFGRELPKTVAERKVVEEFFDGLAHRVTILVHQDANPQDLGLIRRIAELESPAHVTVSISAASYPFLVGIASLVGVDTFLTRPELPRPVRVGESWIGVRDLLTRPPSLDPRMEGGGGDG